METEAVHLGLRTSGVTTTVAHFDSLFQIGRRAAGGKHVVEGAPYEVSCLQYVVTSTALRSEGIVREMPRKGIEKEMG